MLGLQGAGTAGREQTVALFQQLAGLGERVELHAPGGGGPLGVKGHDPGAARIELTAGGAGRYDPGCGPRCQPAFEAAAVGNHLGRGVQRTPPAGAAAVIICGKFVRWVVIAAVAARFRCPAAANAVEIIGGVRRDGAWQPSCICHHHTDGAGAYPLPLQPLLLTAACRCCFTSLRLVLTCGAHVSMCGPVSAGEEQAWGHGLAFDVCGGAA